MAAIHFIDGAWLEGNPPILGPLDHAAWLGSTVFDGRFKAEHHFAYLTDRVKIAEPVTLGVGLRYDDYSLTDESEVTPRFNLAWAPTRTSVLRLAWGRFHQSQRSYEQI